MKKIIFIIGILILNTSLFAQDIPQNISYTRIYDFLDEMANDGYIELNSVIKPYSRQFIADKLVELSKEDDKLNNRQREELEFFLQDYSLEQDKLSNPSFASLWSSNNWEAKIIPPIIEYKDSIFKARIQPLLGMNIYRNGKGSIIQKWWGADFQSTIGKHLSVFGSLRDISFSGYGNARLSDSTYITTFPGYQYKEPSDYSDSRGGITYGWKWGSVGLVKDNIIWGDNYHGSNIISGRAPSFPMISLHLKPANWFEMTYIHGWLVSNIADSTKYYEDNTGNIYYRNHNKFIAANMLTFTPIKGLNISAGNSIIYAEDNIQAGYLIPIAFYKSIDHTLTKGIGTENQNSQMFVNISSRNLKHVHLYTAIYADEFSVSRLKPSNDETNPISYKIGGKVTNFPIDNLSFTGEFTHNNIIVYKHSIPYLTWASNSYNLGSYLGDNAQEIYLELGYKPTRGLDLSLNYTNAKKGNDYTYYRRIGNTTVIKNIISQPFMNDVIWTNQTIEFDALYEIFNNVYARINIANSNIQGHNATSEAIVGENRMTAQEVLDKYTPAFLQGKNTTFTVGLNFGF